VGEADFFLPKSKNEKPTEKNLMRTKIKYLFAGICIGATLGGIILLFLFKYPPEQIHKDDSKEILDFVVGEWTNPKPDTILVAYFGNRNTSGIFQPGKLPDTIRILAAHIETQFGIPKGVICAQFILESKWGLCNLGAQNYFGLTLAAVKRHMARPRYVIRQDTRYANGIAIRENVRFAKFKDIAECFKIYGLYIQGSQLYVNALKHSDNPEMFAKELAKYYAADKDYAMKLITLMRKYKL
jgi:hypothetical protein